MTWKTSNLATRITATLGAASIAAVSLIGLAPAAQAGDSIPPTTNGKTGLNFRYYSSTDDFCVRGPYWGSGGVSFSNSRIGHAGFYPADRAGYNSCWDLKQMGFREGERVKFTLNVQGGFDGNVSSLGYLTV